MKGKFIKGAYIEPLKPLNQLEIKDANLFDARITLNGIPLKLKSYNISHVAMERREITLELGHYELDGTFENFNIILEWNGMKFQRVE